MFLLELRAGGGGRSCPSFGAPVFVGMSPPHHCIHCWRERAVVLEDAIGFVRPDNLSIVRFPPEAARVTEPLSLGEIMLAAPQGLLDALAVLDVGHDTVPLDNVSIFVPPWQAAVQMPSILPIRSEKPNLAFIRFAPGNGSVRPV